MIILPLGNIALQLRPFKNNCRKIWWCFFWWFSCTFWRSRRKRKKKSFNSPKIYLVALINIHKITCAWNVFLEFMSLCEFYSVLWQNTRKSYKDKQNFETRKNSFILLRVWYAHVFPYWKDPLSIAVTLTDAHSSISRAFCLGGIFLLYKAFIAMKQLWEDGKHNWWINVGLLLKPWKLHIVIHYWIIGAFFSKLHQI